MSVKATPPHNHKILNNNSNGNNNNNSNAVTYTFHPVWQHSACQRAAPAWSLQPGPLGLVPRPPAPFSGTGGRPSRPPAGGAPAHPAARGAPPGGRGRREQLRGLCEEPRGPGRHYTAVGRGASRGVPEGVPAAARRGRGRPHHKARFVLRSPRELEPMDWRQLRSSVRQRRGSGPGKGPPGRAGRMGGRGSLCAVVTRLPQLRVSVYPSVQQGRSFPLCPVLGMAASSMEVLTVEPFCNEHPLCSCSVEELEVGFEPQRLPANTGANMVWVGGREERLAVSLSGPRDSRPLSGSQL